MFVNCYLASQIKDPRGQSPEVLSELAVLA